MLLTMPFNKDLAQQLLSRKPSPYHTAEYGGEKISIEGAKFSKLIIIQGQNAGENSIEDFKLTVEGRRAYSSLEKKTIQLSADILFEGKQGFNDYISEKLTETLQSFDKMKDLPLERTSNLGLDFISELSNVGIKIARCPNLDCSILNSHYNPEDNEIRSYVEGLPEDKGILTLTNTLTGDVYAVVISPGQSRSGTPGISEIIKADKNGMIQQKTSYHSDINIGQPNKTEIRMKSGELAEVKRGRTLKQEADHMLAHEENVLNNSLIVPKVPETVTGAGKIEGEVGMSDDELRNMNHDARRRKFQEGAGFNLKMK